MKVFINTPHIRVQHPEGFGKTVLMPGDPLRAKFIAENFLEDAVLVNNVRGIHGYTGYYKGVKVSVMASGMGMPSIGIYSYELFKTFDVQNIIRVGSAGAISEEVKLKDIVVGIGASTNSNFQSQYGLNGTIAPVCSFDLLKAVDTVSKDSKINIKVGSLYSSDTFYDDSNDTISWGKMGCLAVEMEAAALYMTAQRLKKRALAVCTISDLVYPPHTSLPAEDREKTFTDMMILALETAVLAEDLPYLETRN